MVCASRGDDPPPHFKPMAIVINTNLQGDITGIRDTDIASEGLIIDNVTLSNPSGAVHAGDVDRDSDVAPIIDNDDTLGFTNIGYNFSGITVDPKTGDKLGPVMDPIIDPNETYDVAVQSLIDDMMTGVRDIGGTAGPGGTTFRDGEDDNIVVIHPTFRPVGVGYTEVEWTYFAENVGGTATQLQESCANGTFVKGGQLGYTEVEWTYFADNLSGTAGPGGSTFTTGYAEAVGLDSSTVDVMNNLIGSAGPGCDDI